MRYVGDPEPDKPWFPEGSTAGYLVIRDVRSSEGLVAQAVVIADEDGELIITQTEEFKPCQIT